MLYLLTTYLHLGKSSSWALSGPCWTPASLPWRAGSPKGRKTTLSNAWLMHSAWKRQDAVTGMPLECLAAMGAAGGGQRKGQGEGGRTRCTAAVSQEMQLGCVCLLTKMSNACLVLGNVHIPFRDLPALCFMLEELPEVQIFLFIFPFFFFSYNLLTYV